MELNFLTKEKHIDSIEMSCFLADAKFYFCPTDENINIIRCKIICQDEDKAITLLQKVNNYKIGSSFIPNSEFPAIIKNTVISEKKSTRRKQNNKTLAHAQKNL